MTSTPLISVILPTYNRLEFLPKTVESILNQSLSDFELIIINDGSSDGTDQWINEQTDPRIQYINYPKNQGVSFARNKGLDIARGKYIAFADSDDINDPKRFEEQVAAFEADEKIVVCGSNIQFFGSKKLKRRYNENELLYRVKAIYEIPFHFPASMVRQSFLKKENIRFRPEIRSADDYYFLMKIVSKGKATVVPKILYHYRWHDASISVGNTNSQYKNELGINQLAFKEILNLDLRAEEIKLIHRFRRFKCKPKESVEVNAIYQKLMAVAKQTPQLNEEERRSFINSLIHRKLVFDKKKVQLLFFLIKNELRRIWKIIF